MRTQERIICRLCCKICDNFKAIDGDVKNILDVFLPKIDVAATQKPVICASCEKELIKCFDFKMKCFCTRDYIVSFAISKDAVKLDLRDVYLSKNENNAGVAENQDICGFCMSPVESSSAITLDFEEGDVVLKNMIKQCLPELDLSIIKKPVICAPCHGSLENCYCFVTNCLIVDEKIKNYCETLDISDKNQMKLSSLLEFKIRGVPTSQVGGNMVDIVKVEKQLCEDREIADEGEIGKVRDIFKSEPMFYDESENDKEDNEQKNKSSVDVAEMKYYETQFTPKNMLTCKEDSDNLDVVKMEETFCGENFVEMEDHKFLLNEEVEIKTDVSDFSRFENGIILPQSETTTKLRRKQKCVMQNLEGDLSKPYIKPTLTNENATKLTMFQCNCCSFQTKYKHYLKIHLLKHKDPSEVTVYKCKDCSYETKNKYYLKMHLLRHKDPSEVTVYRCDSCSYQTIVKYHFKRHLLKHKDPSERTIYKCNSCSYQTKYKHYLKIHVLMHKDPSEVIMYKCDSCTYETRNKKCFEIHSLRHKDLSLVTTTYNCDVCSYQTVYKRLLKRHSLKHKDRSEVAKHKCNSCSYQAIEKCNLKTHMLLHKNASEVTMYRCDSCSYQTKHKSCLKIHSLRHEDPSVLTTYSCDVCSYQTTYKYLFKRHLLKHKDPLEITVYKCDYCSYQTVEKYYLKAHSLLHKDPSEVTMYKCDDCSYQTKRKFCLKKHLELHKNS